MSRRPADMIACPRVAVPAAFLLVGYRGRVVLAQALTSAGSLALLIAAALGGFLLIAVAVAAPGWARKARYRPGYEWSADPVWFNGPVGGAGVEQAVVSEAAQAADEDAPGGSTGGARATW